LNDCKPLDGWFSQFYGGDPDQTAEANGETEKRPWQLHNTRKLDGIREEIDRLQLDPLSEAVALTSLILALDQVDSTMGHFSSYLRDWSPRSYKKMYLQIPEIVESRLSHKVTHGDIFKIASNTTADLAYYDPPYGSNNEKMPPSRVRYAAYYHVWTTICLNDKPMLFGKVNRRVDTRDHISGSVFEEFRQDRKGKFLAVEAIRRLIKETQTKYIILSYSSGGRATATELNEAMNEAGEVLNVIEVDYRKNVMAGMTSTNEWLRDAEEPNREFLFLLKRRH
jgi:adenine-specific DNA-methyltransferase